MPAAEGPVIVDATPIVALAGLGRLDLFRSLYGGELVPPAVWHELETRVSALAAQPVEVPVQTSLGYQHRPQIAQ